MISTKDIIIKIGNSGKGKELSKEDLNKLQKHLFKMYRDIEAVCNLHGIQICLAYGNVIGAMRHNGWIPWDDDWIFICPDRIMNCFYPNLPQSCHLNIRFRPILVKAVPVHVLQRS